MAKAHQLGKAKHTKDARNNAAAPLVRLVVPCHTALACGKSGTIEFTAKKLPLKGGGDAAPPLICYLRGGIKT
jgi:hypothetical protein